MHNIRAALRRTFARDVFPPGPNAGCGNVCPRGFNGVRGACHRAGHFGPDPLTPPIPRWFVESRALMQMVNELGRDADFDEQSGRQKQQDARQDGIGRCAFLALNIVCHDHTTA